MKPLYSKKDFEEIYNMLEKVSPVDFDCGVLCSCICCTCSGTDDVNENSEENEMGLYLLPGEESMFTFNEDWIEWDYLEVEKYDYPESWDGTVPFFQCKTPPKCPRKCRPIQCRTFPLTPHIENGIFHLIFENDDLPYSCPLVKNHTNHPLNEDFIETTFKAWKKLIKDPLIHDLVKLDSDYRRKQGWSVESVRSESLFIK